MKNMVCCFLISLLMVGCSVRAPSSIEDEINGEILSRPSAAGGVEESFVFYVDPVNGDMGNPGTKDLPWFTLEEVIKSKFIETKDADGVINNIDAPVKPGDTIILRSGYHGDILLKNAYNDKMITVKSEVDNTPIISSLILNYGSNWDFDGMTVDGSLSSSLGSSKSYMISLGANGKRGISENVTIQNFHIYSDQNIDAWNTGDWNEYAYNGILCGKYLKNILIRNSYVENVNLAMNLASEGAVAIGNRVSYFTKDAIRVSNNHATLMHNIITDNLDVNDNHDDGIQGYAGKLGMKDILMSGNIIIEHYDYSNPYPGPLQGIGFFDGPLSRIVAENNIVKVSGYHAISLYDSIGGRVMNNTVTGTKGHKSRIALGTKNKGGVDGNMVASNFSQVFLLDKDKSAIQSENKVIKTSGNSMFNSKLKALTEEINSIYGAFHVTSGKMRFDGNFD